MSRKSPIKEFLQEYRALCVKHGYLITMNRDDQPILDVLNPAEMILIQMHDGALRFISIDELRILKIDKHDSSYAFLPMPDEMERAVQKKELVFREEIASQIIKINEKQSK